MTDDRVVRAAGGLVVRDDGRGPELLLVHRGRYDDWTLPKGKLDDGETFEEAAVREVAEETGLRCELGVELPEVRYEVRGRPKQVRYWAMTVLDGELGADDPHEIDDVRWFPLDEARTAVSYAADRGLIDAWVGAER